MKKFIKFLSLGTALSLLLAIQSCKEDDAKPAAPTVTGPTAIPTVQVGAKADVTFTFAAPGAYASSSATATGGTATVKTAPAADAIDGSVVVEFTAGTTAGAGSVTLSLTDASGQTATQTAVINISLSAPPAITLSAATASAAAGGTAVVTATITAANGAKSISYTTTGGLTGVPASPITITGGPTGATPQVITFTVPATAVVGGTLTAVITGTDTQNLNSSAVTFTITASEVANVLTGTPTADVTLTSGTPWTVKGQYIIASGRTLTVNPGAIVKGDKASKGVIIIQPGGKLMAVGTLAQPIVFTSSQPINERDRGDWGGIVWLGSAFVNQSTSPNVEGISPNQTYGTPSTTDANAGTNTQDNGKLKYARIEYAGVELSPNNETNSLTMGALGSATEIDYVQASYGGDDGFEWFGGTAGAKHLVSFAMWDDDFDTDFGWRGNVQFGVSVRAPFIADQSGSTAFESDSQANANPIGSICDGTTRTGCTQGVFSNMTVYGPRDYSRAISGSYTRAVHIRRSTAISIFNSVITGFNQGIQFDDALTTGNYPTNYTANASSTALGKLANNELYVSLLPTVPGTIGSTTAAVTSITAATGNSLFNSANLNAQNAYRATGAANNDYAPLFVAQWVRNGSGVITGQSIRNTWQSAAGTLVDIDDAGTTTVDEQTVSFAQGLDVTLVNGAAVAQPWTNDVTSVPVGNPYVGSGLRTTPFYAANSSISYPPNPDFTVNTADATVAGKRLDQGGLFTDGRLTTGFTSTTYRGAFDGTTDWTDGWSEFVPLIKVY